MSDNNKIVPYITSNLNETARIMAKTKSFKGGGRARLISDSSETSSDSDGDSGYDEQTLGHSASSDPDSSSQSENDSGLESDESDDSHPPTRPQTPGGCRIALVRPRAGRARRCGHRPRRAAFFRFSRRRERCGVGWWSL